MVICGKICWIELEFLANFLGRTHITNTKYNGINTNECCSQLLIQFILNVVDKFCLC